MSTPVTNFVESVCQQSAPSNGGKSFPQAPREPVQRNGLFGKVRLAEQHPHPLCLCHKTIKGEIVATQLALAMGENLTHKRHVSEFEQINVKLPFAKQDLPVETQLCCCHKQNTDGKFHHHKHG